MPQCYISTSQTKKTSKPKTSKKREIMKIRAEINELETKNTIQKINETKTWFFENINKIDKPLANLTKMRREKTQVNKIRSKKEEITTPPKKSRKSSETTLGKYIP
jgi:hypothetical protein